MTERTGGHMGLWGVVAIGVGGMIGGGIFAVLGLSAEQGRGAAPLAFAVGGAVALLTAHSYARLSARYPNRGGTVAFLNHGFGTGAIAGAGNVFLWASYIVMLALYASAFGSYGAALLPTSVQPTFRHVLATVVVLALAALNFASADVIARAERAIVIAKVAILALFVIAGFTTVQRAALAPADWPGAGTIVAAGMLVFAAYEGFELIANTAEDVADPAHTLTRAYFISVGFVASLYMLVALVVVGSLSIDTIRRESEFVLAVAARPLFGEAGFVAIAIAAMLSTASAINATLYGSARLSYAIAKSGELPAAIARPIWDEPVAGLIGTAGLAVVLTNTFPVGRISFLGSAGFLLIFLVINGVAARLTDGVSRAISMLGFVAAAAALATLLDFGRRTDMIGLAAFGVVLAGSFAVEWAYRILTGREIDIRGQNRAAAGSAGSDARGT